MSAIYCPNRDDFRCSVCLSMQFPCFFFPPQFVQRAGEVPLDHFPALRKELCPAHPEVALQGQCWNVSPSGSRVFRPRNKQDMGIELKSL